MFGTWGFRVTVFIVHIHIANTERYVRYRLPGYTTLPFRDTRKMSLFLCMSLENTPLNDINGYQIHLAGWKNIIYQKNSNSSDIFIYEMCQMFFCSNQNRIFYLSYIQIAGCAIYTQFRCNTDLG